MRKSKLLLLVVIVLLAEGAAFCLLVWQSPTRVETLVDASAIKRELSFLQTSRLKRLEPILAAEGGFRTLATSTQEIKKVAEEPINRLVLPAPLYYQEHSLSCEIAALRMALAGVGLKVNEQELIDKMPINPAPRVGNLWGDPDKEFVGSIDGAQNTTGYGVYWPVITNLAKLWRPDSVGSRGFNYLDVVRELKAGHPLIYWGVVSEKMRPDSWQTVEGKTIKAWSGEHARTIIGYEGNDNNPSYLIVNDPTYGQLKISKRTFLRDWAHFDNSLVVIK